MQFTINSGNHFGSASFRYTLSVKYKHAKTVRNYISDVATQLHIAIHLVLLYHFLMPNLVKVFLMNKTTANTIVRIRELSVQ